MFRISDLPALNACLNATSVLFLLLGHRAIQRFEIDRHRRLMIAAAVTSAVVLASYLTYHAKVGSVHFSGEGAIRAIYFTFLFSHTALAAAYLLSLLDALPSWLSSSSA